MKAYLKSFLGAAGMGLMVLSFQNCSDFALQEGVLSESSLLGSISVVDSANIPRLLSSEKILRWSKPGQPNYIDKTGRVFMDEVSAIAAFPKTATGTIINVTSGTEQSKVTVSGNKIIVAHHSDANNYTYLETALPSLGDNVVVAASFGLKPTDITVLVNGVLQTAKVIVVGVPGDYSYISRNVAVHNQVVEHIVFAGDSTLPGITLTASELNSMARYVANNNMIANVIFDPSVVNPGNGGGDTVTVDPLFLAAKAIIDARCISCHTGANGVVDLRNMTAAKAVQRSLVVAKNPQRSPLYNRLYGSSGSGKKDMPTNNPLSAKDVQTIYDWIAGL